MVVVVALEGIHGVGKTTVINMLKEAGRTVIGEEFMDTAMNKYSPTGIPRQIVWLANWIQRVVRVAEDTQRRNILYIDRSMLSALMYNTVEKDKDVMEYIIQKSIGELKDMGIKIYTILLTDDKQEAWTRIQERLEKEPHRVEFNEHKIEHYKRVWNEYYCTHRNMWNASLESPIHLEKKVVLQKIDNIVERLL